jgi:Leucine-rich repeat (LRR) protein
VQLCENEITDITPLAKLPALKTLLIADNPIKDYAPLKDIYPKLETKDFEID